jgi:hypothetical protein
MPLYDLEYTNLRAGKPAWDWTTRKTLDFPPGIHEQTVLRQAKLLCGLEDRKGRVFTAGSVLEYRPFGLDTVLFLSPHIA